MFFNVDGGFLEPANSGPRVLQSLQDKLELPKLNFRVFRRSIVTRAQKLGSVKDVKSHLRHSRASTNANEYMQELPESVQQMVGEVYAMLMSTATRQAAWVWAGITGAFKCAVCTPSFCNCFLDGSSNRPSSERVASGKP
jgi:hypothetical protein